MSDRLTLAKALKEGRLADFVDQAERDGIGTAPEGAFDALLRVITAPRPEGRTSHSRVPGGSRET